jgi:starch-binding outer membrane protein, SusD/RagB family
MKTLKYIMILLVLGTFSACHELDVEVQTEMTPDIFPKDSTQFIQASGPVYAALRGNYALDYWFTQTLSTDEAILPARGGNWFDGGKYMELHYHSWTKDNAFVNSTWVWLSQVISYSNQTLSILEKNEPDTYAKKSENLAEIRMVRAIAYFMMMDLYGNVPIVTTYGDFTPKENSSRSEVFDFIESEVNACIPDLSRNVGIYNYGRPTQFAAYALLAKMYLNAQVYTGADRFNDCIAACDKIIESGKFSIEPLGSYLQMFYPNNGPGKAEFIFAIPYDPTAIPVTGTNGFMYRARYDVPRSHQARFNLPFKPSAPESTLPEFYAHFEGDINDVRNKQWLTGLQYMADGTTPITVKTTNLGYDYTYSGGDPAGTYQYQVELTPNIELRLSPSAFDCGNDEIAWNMGYRNIKFYPDATSTSRNQNNDMPLFRYSDIILMKAEAILRGGTATLGVTALDLVNQVRAQRSTSDAWTSVSLEELFEERSREFAMETWHRNDMIRFGKYEDSWGFKTNNESYRSVFPIPTIAFKYNPGLIQNDGY